MSSENVDSMVKEAIKAYRAGDKASARAMLEKATEMYSHNEKAWMWLSAVVDSVEDQRVCLENVLFLNPDNENARRGLQILDSQDAGSAAVDGHSEPASDPTPTETYDDYAVTASSSASSTYNPSNEPSPDEYDDWIANMGIGSDGGGNIPGDFTQDMTSGPFTQPSNDDGFADVFGGAFDDDPYADDSDTGGVSADDRLFAADINDIEVEDLFAPPPDEPAVDPMADDFDTNSLFDDGDDPFAGEDDLAGGPFATTPTPVDEVAPPVPARKAKSNKKRRKRQPSSGGGAFVDNSGPADPGDPSYYFRAIPKEIKATRLPGSGGGNSPLTFVLLVVLIAANIGAVALLAVG